MDGASYRQAAARYGVSTSVAWKWSQGFRHIAANQRARIAVQG